MKKKIFKILLLLAAALIVSAVILDSHIRHKRNALQLRAKEFLSRPVPSMFQTNEISVYQARENQDVLFVSRTLIERYAKNGRIRWSAAIQGQFAVQPFETSACEDAAQSNNEARNYIEDCKAILAEEWRMGYWQWVEDVMELKRKIPEIEEEDFRPSANQKTNNSTKN